MTLKELKQKYKGYEIYYWGKSTFIKTMADCKQSIPFTGLSGVNAKDYDKLKVLDFEIIEKPSKAINLSLTSKGLVGKGVTKYKGMIYILLDKEKYEEVD